MHRPFKPFSLQAGSVTNSKTPMMKRSRKLPPEKRQKVSTACDGCKKRKFKCTGTQPCKLCSKKGIDCVYSIVDKRSLKGQNAIKATELDVDVIDDRPLSSDSKSTNDEKPHPNQVFSPSKSPVLSTTTSVTSTTIDLDLVHPDLYMINNLLKYSVKSDYIGIVNSYNHLNSILNSKPFSPPEIQQDMKLLIVALNQLPTKQEMLAKITVFNGNYCCWTIFNQKDFDLMLSSAYDLNEYVSKYFIILYLICGVVDSAESYFKKALMIFHSEGEMDLDIWLVRIHFLIYINYRNSKLLYKSYFHLGNAINLSKLLNLDLSYLAINDTLLSVLVGVPSQLNIDIKSDDQLQNLIHILNQIISEFYNKPSSTFNIYKLKELSIDLKSWSLNLPSSLNLNEPFVLNLHLINLTSILLLSRPLHLYHMLTIINPKSYTMLSCSSICLDYFSSAINLAVYSIFLIHKFQVFNDVSLNLLHQSCHVLYYSILFMEKFNLAYTFNMAYLRYILSLGAICCGDSIYNLGYTEAFQDINIQDIKCFQDYFVNSEIAPTFKKSVEYGLYDKLVLNKFVTTSQIPSSGGP